VHVELASADIREACAPRISADGRQRRWLVELRYCDLLARFLEN
jgi:hypothetical protein